MARRDSFDCWCVRLKHVEKPGQHMRASVLKSYFAFNTWKFMSYEAALAWCRKEGLDPRDNVIVRVRYRDPDVLETREIEYGTSELSLASK